MGTRACSITLAWHWQYMTPIKKARPAPQRTCCQVKAQRLVCLTPRFTEEKTEPHRKKLLRAQSSFNHHVDFYSIHNSSAAHLFGQEARYRFFQQYKAMTLVHHGVVDVSVRTPGVTELRSSVLTLTLTVSRTLQRQPWSAHSHHVEHPAA